MVFIGADHGGFGLKKEIIRFFDLCAVEYEDCGAFKFNQDDDYPEFAKIVAHKVVKRPKSLGILICGTGTGMVIAANKIRGIRAAVGCSEYAAKMARRDNNANILAFSGRKQTSQEVLPIIKIFIETEFSGLERYERRLEEIEEIENEKYK